MDNVEKENGKTKIYLLIVAFVFLLVAAAWGWISSYQMQQFALTEGQNYQGKISDRDDEIATLQADGVQLRTDLDTAKGDLDAVSSDLEDASVSLADALSTITVQSETIETQSGEASDLADTLATAEATIEAKQSANSQLASSYAACTSDLDACEQITVCQDLLVQPVIDYTSNQTVSNSLKAWLEDTEGSMNSAKWDSVWSNSRASIHKLTGEFLWVFVVMFDEPDLSFSESVFWISGSGACFLDPPD